MLTPMMALGAKNPMYRRTFTPQLDYRAANQFMGSMTLSGDALYFVSDANVSTEIFVQSPVSSGRGCFR